MHGTQSLAKNPAGYASSLNEFGRADATPQAIMPGAIGRLADLCAHANKLQDHACKISAVLEDKLNAMHGPRPTAGQAGPKDAQDAAGGFDSLALKLQSLEGFLARLALLANQI